jgi:hypothetical protein
MVLSDWAKDTLIAPEMSKFTQATIREMDSVDARMEHLLANFLLNVLGGSDPGVPMRQRCFNFLRRSQAAAREYKQARELTLRYLDAPDLVFLYVEAMTHWETFMAHAWQAFTVLASNVWFKPGDGSEFERLNLLYGRAKHTEKAIATPGQMPGDSPLSVWLTNDGLRCTDGKLTFDEMADILEELARISNLIEDPGATQAKLAAQRAASLAGP